MASVLKGNFKTDKTVQVDKADEENLNSLEERFEREALKRLGGSLAFVRKKKEVWRHNHNIPDGHPSTTFAKVSKKSASVGS